MNLDEGSWPYLKDSNRHMGDDYSRERRAGKQKAQSTQFDTDTLELIRAHLSGVKGVGSIPINEDNQCKFGVLDIDTHWT